MAITESSVDELTTKWQAIPATSIATLMPEQALAELKTERHGLTTHEATIRLAALGTNDLTIRRGWRSIFGVFAIVVRPLLLPLWIAAFIAFGIDRMYMGQALLVIAALNTIVAAIQERKVERAAAALHDILPAFARVLRDGREQNIMASMLVPGDILLLRPNDSIPADARLIEAHDLHTVDTVLSTEESVVHRIVDAVFDDDHVTEQLPNVVYAGGRVVSGHGTAVVFATGTNTAFGKIAALTQRAQEEPSPLLWAFAHLGNVVLGVGLISALLGFLYVYNQLRLTIEESLTIAVLFLTAAVPTGLMPGITLALIEGARRLQKHKAIFRRLSNVETLGATTVICADKTGTLTQNEMTVREVWTADGPIVVTGVGYLPQGQFIAEHRPLDTANAARHIGALLRGAVLTSTARLLPPDTLRPHWHILGDPTEASLIVAAAKAHIKAADVYEQIPQIAVLNSDRDTALDGVIVQEHSQTFAYVKGTPRELLARCTALATMNGERPLTDRDRQAIKKVLHRHQRDAMRTVAFARRALTSADPRATRIDDVAHDLVLLGMMAVVDPPRQEVAEAIEACHNAHIRTIMLTGDDMISSTSIARRCTMVRSTRSTVLSGPEIDAMNQATLKERLRHGDMVLARLTPEHKVRVVQALEELGEVVLVTGGAASDVPALKAAYTGIAMGASGSAAACQAADLVLLDDNFATIAEAIAEGRAVEQRVRRLVALNLATTVAKIVALIAALVFGLPLLLTVGQQLLIDLLAGLLPGLAIGAGRPDPRLMLRSPRPTGRPLLARKVYLLGYGWFGGLTATLALLTSIFYVVQVHGQYNLRDLIVSNLLAYEARIADEAGRHGLVATSLYVVMSVAALLGAALIRRSAAPNDRRPLLLLLGLVGLSFGILVVCIIWPTVHAYIALTTIPTWGWGVALAGTVLVAGLEFVRQRLDPIFKPQPTIAAQQPLGNIPSAKS
ncbi:MAG TPA: cation-transporting P-type ATPase [Herpetosiphonaceae bacterium]